MLYVILTYDFNEKRVAKALKICRRYLLWVQNSVFEGEISPFKFERLKMDLKRIMVEEEDSVRFYILRSEKEVKVELMGYDKAGEYQFI